MNQIWRELTNIHHGAPDRQNSPGRPQRPRVAVLTCADARIANSGLRGVADDDVFSVRVAGAIATTEAIASLGFAVLQLQVPLVVVMTHHDCGAIMAAQTTPDHERQGPLAALLKAVDEHLVTPSDNEPPAHAVARTAAQRVREGLDVLCGSAGVATPPVIAATINHDTDQITTVDMGLSTLDG